MTNHASDCAIYNAPAMATGPCNCGAEIHIPPAALNAIADTIEAACPCLARDEAIECARAALAAGLAVWPSVIVARRGTVFINTWQEPEKGEPSNVIILPLPEVTNDKG